MVNAAWNNRHQSFKQHSGRWEHWLTGTDYDYPDHPIDAELYADSRYPVALSIAHGFDADTLELELAIKKQIQKDEDRGIKTYKFVAPQTSRPTPKEQRIARKKRNFRLEYARQKYKDDVIKAAAAIIARLELDKESS